MREYCTQWLGVTEMFVTMNIFWAAFVCCWAVPGDIRGSRRASSPSLESSPFRGKKIERFKGMPEKSAVPTKSVQTK